MKNDISKSILGIGAEDTTIDLFEGKYAVPEGISYNSYVILDDKIAVMDTIDARKTDEWLQNLQRALGGRTPYCVVVSHMEPDHAASLQRLAVTYPDIRIVGNAKTFAMIPRFFDIDRLDERKIVVGEGDTLELGSHRLHFVMAPMVHWPEVMVTYEESEKVLFSAETVWHPKLNDDPDYHYALIKSDMLKAASYLPRIDKIGVSSAGIYVDNKIMLASLFIKVPDDLFENKVKNMYIDIARELNAPVTVANDGDVAALAGAMEAGEGNILGIAMGTSEAAGFIDADNNLWGWLNELAFVPVDLNESAAVDEWSGDIGTGVKYLSQDAVIKLAEAVGLTLDGDSPAQKLKSAQEFVREGNPKAVAVFTDIGEYLAYALLYYRAFYGFKNVLLRDIVLSLPDEAKRRVGQAVAAAAL